jgi:transposase-like protein
LAPRLAVAFGVVAKREDRTTPLATVFEAIRSAKGPAGDTVRALLTGSDDSPAALLLRRVIETRRGSALPVVDIENGGSINPEIQAVIDAEKAFKEKPEDDDDDDDEDDDDDARPVLYFPEPKPPEPDPSKFERQRKRAERAALKIRILALTDEPGAVASAIARAHGLKPHTVLQWRKLRDEAAKKAAAEVKEAARRRKRAEQCAKHAAAIAARSARQLERDAESARKLAARTARDRQKRRVKTPDDIRAELCSEDPDELSERIGYVESVRRGERP